MKRLACGRVEGHCALYPSPLSTLILPVTLAGCIRVWGRSSWKRQQKGRLGDRSIIPSALSSRNWGPRECCAMGRFSGLWPRPNTHMRGEAGVQPPSQGPRSAPPFHSQPPPARFPHHLLLQTGITSLFRRLWHLLLPGPPSLRGCSWGWVP